MDTLSALLFFVRSIHGWTVTALVAGITGGFHARWASNLEFDDYFVDTLGILTIIGSNNGLSPGRRQAIIWTNAGILLIEPLGTNFSEILVGIQIFTFKKMRLKMSSAKWRPFCLGLNVSNVCGCLVKYDGTTLIWHYF